METKGSFAGARTHDWQVFINYKSDALPTALRCLNILIFDFIIAATYVNCKVINNISNIL